jgi:UDPglucose--hexose-1-phosphate uridylyltransferase
MDDKEMLALAEVIKDVLQRYKTVLNDPPYNMMLQTAPTTLPRPGHPEYWGTIAYDFHWSIQIIPRLTKQAGFEWGTGFFINPVSPELAAESLQVTSS